MKWFLYATTNFENGCNGLNGSERIFRTSLTKALCFSLSMVHSEYRQSIRSYPFDPYSPFFNKVRTGFLEWYWCQGNITIVPLLSAFINIVLEFICNFSR
jgi:hypothetical protein